MRAAHAGLKHASAPYRNSEALCDIMDGEGLRKATDAADLDVDDATGTQLQSRFCITRIVNGFVQAERGFEHLLQTRVKVEVVVPQRLLDHQQLESVEALHVLLVRQCIR